MGRQSVSPAGPETIKPYLTYSFGLHFTLAAAALWLSSRAAMAPSNAVYTIDFVGPSAAIVANLPESAAPKAAPAPESAPAKPQPQTEFDEFGRRRSKRFVLPRPSLLKGFTEKKAEAPPAPAVPERGTAAPQAAGSPGAAGIETDMPNFPYPWYISQVRASLWSRWSARMPKQAGECVVSFSLLPNGSIVDLRTEQSSGDSAFDLAALSVAQDAAPYPPLPRGFREPFLKIHVTLKSN